MSSRVRIKTLRFCTQSQDNLLLAIKLCSLTAVRGDGRITVNGEQITVAGEFMYMQVREDNRSANTLFLKINGKLAEIEEQLRASELERNLRRQKEAEENAQAYAVRKLKSEEQRLEYEREMLELERNNFVDAKKRAIAERAREMGYSVREESENGVVKLKLIKRIY